jgi:hypothetical protein
MANSPVGGKDLVDVDEYTVDLGWEQEKKRKIDYGA